MQIPIQNIYYLLCYAWNRLEEGELVKAEDLDSSEVLDLLTCVLVNGIKHIRRRGLERDYVEYAEDTSTLRGRIDFGVTLKRQLLRHARAHCEYDILSYDVLHNQIIKATLTKLLKVRELDKDLRESVWESRLWFRDVSDIQANGSEFRRVVLHRNNAFYAFVLNVCELLLDNILVSEESGESVFRDFLRDENRVSMLFQHFVRNFYDREAPEFKVGAEEIKWVDQEGDETSAAFLPTMCTDISLTSPSRKVIIDTKYYVQTLAGRFDPKRVRSEHLYQMFAYLKNAEFKDELGKTCEGILLYPTVDDGLNLRYHLSGHPVRICTINLNQDWRGVHQDLLALLE